VLIHDGDGGVRLKHDVRVKHLKQRGCQASGVRCEGLSGKELRGCHAGDHGTETGPGPPDTRRLTPHT